MQGVCTYNDDIESTAAAVVGALYGAVQVSGMPRLADQHFLFVGAGQASIGSARLVAKALAEEGLSQEEARKRIWLTDSKVGGWGAARGGMSLHCRLAEALLSVLLMLHERFNAEQALLRMWLTDSEVPGSLREVRV